MRLLRHIGPLDKTTNFSFSVGVGFDVVPRSFRSTYTSLLPLIYIYIYQALAGSEFQLSFQFAYTCHQQKGNFVNRLALR